MTYLATQLPWIASSLKEQIKLEPDPIPEISLPYERLVYEVTQAWEAGQPYRDQQRRMQVLFQDWFHAAGKDRLNLPEEAVKKAYEALLTHAMQCQASPVEQFNPWVTETMWEEFKVDLRKGDQDPQVFKALGNLRNASTSHALLFPVFSKEENLEEAFSLLLVVSSYDVLCYLSTLRTISKEEIRTSSVVAAYGALYDQLSLPEDKAFNLTSGTLMMEVTSPNAIKGNLYSTIYTNYANSSITSFKDLPRTMKKSVLGTLRAYRIQYCEDLEKFMAKRAVDLHQCGLGYISKARDIHEELFTTSLQSRYLAKYYGKRGLTKVKAGPGDYGTHFRMYALLGNSATPLNHFKLTMETQDLTSWRDYYNPSGELEESLAESLPY